MKSQLPKGWEVKKLGAVCEFQNGFAFKSKTYKESGLPIIRITNIQNQSINTSELVYFDTKDYQQNFERFRVFKDDLVIAMSGATTGKIGINNTDTIFYLNQRVGKFIPKTNLLKPFLYYFLTTKVEESLKIAAGAAQPNLSTEQINNFEIPLPPLSEQTRIVSILDKCFSAIDKAKANADKNLKNAKELFESYLNGIFDTKGDEWEEKKLGEVLNLLYGKPLEESKRKQDGRYPMYGANGIKGRTDEFYHDRKSIIVGRKGSAGEINLTDEKFWPLDVTYFITFDETKYDLMFLYFLLLKQKITKLARGVKPGINRNEIYEIQVKLPLISEQQNIVKKLDALSAETKRMEAIYQQKLLNLEELKKSLLQKAFRGEL